MTAKEAIRKFTADDDHEDNHRCYPLLAKAFNEINGSFEIPAPFHKWLIALGCPDDASQLMDAAIVTSSLFAGLLECIQTELSDDPESDCEMMRQLVGCAKHIDEQVWRMRQAISAIEETLEPSASIDSTIDKDCSS